MKKILTIVLAVMLCLSMFACQKPCTHEWGEAKIVSATCKDAGTSTKTCKLCDEEDVTTLPKTNEHSYGSASVTKPATCAEEGTRTKTCRVCSNQLNETIPKKTNHTYEPDVASSVAANCVTKGTKVEKCSVCGDKKSEETPINANVHKETSGACGLHCNSCGTGVSHAVAACGVDGHFGCDGGNYMNHQECTLVGSACLNYELSVDGKSYIVTGIDGAKITGTSIIVPAFYNNKPVVEIKNNAFFPNDNNKAALKNITTVYISDSVQLIGEYFLFWTPVVNGTLKNVKLPRSLNNVKLMHFIFAANGIENYVIPQGVSQLDGNSFAVASISGIALKNVYIPKSLTSMVGGFVFNTPSQKTGDKVNIYFEGTQTEWDFLVAQMAGSAQNSVKACTVVTAYNYTQAVDTLYTTILNSIK